MITYVDYCIAYYNGQISRLKAMDRPSAGDVYFAKQLLKLVDDFCDEGYFSLRHALDASGDYGFLHGFIAKNGEAPFPVTHMNMNAGRDAFGESCELCQYIESLVSGARGYCGCPRGDTIREIKRFTDWATEDGADTTFLFLLRDTFLPYLYCVKALGRGNAIPAIIGRSFFDCIGGKENLDDDIRQIMINGLADASTLSCLKAACKSHIDRFFADNPRVYAALMRILSTIKGGKIRVIESGVHGTFPFLLSMLDPRVEFRLYTCVMFFRDVYKGLCYTDAYEKNRLFETLYSQDKLFVFDGYGGGGFMVRERLDEAVRREALSEIGAVLCGD